MLLKTPRTKHLSPEEIRDNSATLSPPSLSASANEGRVVEKRRERRYPTMDAVEICIVESGRQQVAGTVVDVSRNGLRLELAVPISNGARLEIVLHTRAIIVGVARHCQSNEVGYHVGVFIEDIYYAQSISVKHLHDDQLSLYLVGKGLTVIEVIQIKDHLAACGACLKRLDETEVILRRRQSAIKTNCLLHDTRVRRDLRHLG